MELSLLLARQILSMLIMIFVGFATVRLGLLKKEDSRVLSALVLYVLGPCLFFAAFQIDYSPEKLKGLLFGIIASAAVNLLTILISEVVGRILHLSVVEKTSAIYTNCGNLIMPLTAAVLGNEYVFYGCAFTTVQTLLIWTHLISCIKGKRSFNFVKIITNPSIIATLAGLVIFILPFSFPAILNETIEKISSTIGPVSMFSIGMIMSGFSLKKVFTDLRAFLVCLVRLVLVPAVIILIIAATGITGRLSLAYPVLLTVVLAAAAPSAVSVAQLAELHGGDSERAGVINVMSTLLCIITIPLMIGLYQILCG